MLGREDYFSSELESVWVSLHLLKLTSGIMPKNWPLQARVSHTSFYSVIIYEVLWLYTVLHNEKNVPRRKRESKVCLRGVYCSADLMAVII